MHGHIIVCGDDPLGMRIIEELQRAGRGDPRREFARRELDVPVIFGDAKLRQTLEAARLDEARAVALLTQDDMVNIETGIVLREILGPRVLPELNRPDVPIVLRLYDRALDAAVAQPFGFDYVRSTVELAAPWFIGAAMGLQVFGTFSVGQRSFMVGGVRVERGSALDGLRMADLSTQTRVIAITRAGQGRPAATPARHPGHGRGHRLPRRAVPGTAGHAAQGTAHPAVRRQSLSDARLNPAPVGSATTASRP